MASEDGDIEIIGALPPPKRKLADFFNNKVTHNDDSLHTPKFQKKLEDNYTVDFDITTAIHSILKNINFDSKIGTHLKEVSDKFDSLENSSHDINNLITQTECTIEKLKSVLLLRDNNIHNSSLNKIKDSSLIKVNGISLPSSHSVNNQGFKFGSQSDNLHSLTSNKFGNSRLFSNNFVKSSSQVEDVADVIHVGQVAIKRPNLPSMGPIEKEMLTCGMKLYAMKTNTLGVWVRAKIVAIKPSSPEGKKFKVKFETNKAIQSRTYSAKHLAYTKPPNAILPVGSRIIAHFRDESWRNSVSSLYAGIIAEPPKIMNNYRYLVFFDDGCAQYIKHTEVYLICESSKEVHEDIHPDSMDFIKNYLQQYPERPMVKLQKGQVVKTEWNGSWWVTRVLEVDASLVKVCFDADERVEWIYRGSTRLAPLFNELANAQANRLAGKNRRHNLKIKKQHRPYVEYTRSEGEDPMSRSEVEIVDDENERRSDRRQVAKKHTGGLRNVARKSTSNERQDYAYEDYVPLPIVESEMGQPNVTKLEQFIHVKYYPHNCGPICKQGESIDSYIGKNPLEIPLLMGWERQLVKHRTIGKRMVFYRAPCGRRLRSIEDVNYYLWNTRSLLTIDLFCFDSYVHIFSEYVPSRKLYFLEDITRGEERVPVCCVNSVTADEPPYLKYSAKRTPTKGVNLILDPNFLCGCDCEDNCQDREECSCQQLTVIATEAHPSGRISDAGYKFRRLTDPLLTAIYECNSNCKCGPNCMNRVVQNGLQVKLQVFKTENRGWGIRCLNDIPQGMFICNYAGQLLTEQGANEDGNQFGDEYLAELDHIEVVEKEKEDYESEVEEPLESNEENDSDDNTASSEASSSRRKYNNNDSDSDFTPHVATSKSVNYVTRSKERLSKSSHSERSKHKLYLTDSSNCNDKTEEWLSSISSGNSEYSDTGTEASKDFLPDTDCKDTVDIDISSMPNRKYRPRIPSPDTMEQIKSSELARKPRLLKGTKSDNESFSDSEDSKSSQDKRSKTSTNISCFGIVSDLKKSPAKSETKTSKFVPTRFYFGEEYCYILDAKSCGNIGRYLNHSCTPNVFVQNVFVDTHDLRFPWVSFFAMVYIRAGTELTWDYHYEVGSVPNKILYCECGSRECRGRLL